MEGRELEGSEPSSSSDSIAEPNSFFIRDLDIDTDK